MSLDTVYRPITFDDVLGQDSSIAILKQYVKTGAGFHQSYLFSGQWGSGKTTLARIHARALLCASPVGGAPCDHCTSCRSILIRGSSENFFEVDAATNSGKDSIKRIVDEIQYSTFSGKRRIYLMDESHRLSKDALDALLKPLEDCVPGGQDKLLVCLFCTTEPEGMRKTILSRCAPAFVINPVTPELLATRLDYVCKKEGIEFEPEALVLLGELTECHFRDAQKAIEGVSMLGGVTVANVTKYLHLDYSTSILSVLGTLKSDLPTALKSAEDLLKLMSPITVYERLADMCMLAYKSSLGATAIPRYLDSEKVRGLGSELGLDLLTFADRFSSRPGRPTPAMVLCDLAQLHRGPVVQMISVSVPEQKKIQPQDKILGKSEDKPQMVDSVFVHPRAVNIKPSPAPLSSPKPELPPGLPPREFFHLVKMRFTELQSAGRENAIGQERRDDVGHFGIDESRGTESPGRDPGDNDST